jgi:hypothetical protein
MDGDDSEEMYVLKSREGPSSATWDLYEIVPVGPDRLMAAWRATTVPQAGRSYWDAVMTPQAGDLDGDGRTDLLLVFYNYGWY